MVEDNYVWLKSERAHHDIYAVKVHWKCVCIWEISHNGPEGPDASLKLIARKKACPIHGAKGWL
jgi:hypothetical protein